LGCPPQRVATILDESVSGHGWAANRQSAGINRCVALRVAQIDVGELSAEGQAGAATTATASTASAATSASAAAQKTGRDEHREYPHS
jgi:ribosomal protein L12E/L44/L45/RPP1/RPP2